MRSAIIALVLLLGVVCASAATCSAGQSEVSFTSSSSTGSATKLILANNLSFNADVQYVYVSGSTLGVTVTGCADAALAKKLGFAWSTSGDAITLTASSDKTDNPSGTVGNSASKLAPMTTLMALAFGMLLVIRPKNVSSIVLIMAILGVAMYAQADTTATITIKISVPDSIASVCTSASSCTARTPGNVPYVNVMGDRYATMDLNTACDTSKVLSMPAGWRMATATDATVFAAIAFNSWDTNAIILADGNAYTNNKNGVVANSNAFTAVDGGYKVNTCNQKILIIQTFTYSNTQPAIVSTLSVSNYVSFNGYDYATADNIAYTTAGAGSQAGGVFISTSNAWQVAPFEDATVVALSKSNGNFFGCACAVFAGGNAYTASFGACGTAQLVTVSATGGSIVGVAGKQRVVVRRASTAPNSFWASNSITYSYVYNGVEFATLDNKDPLLIDSDNCQSRFYALPTGYTIATSAQLNSFILGTLGKNIYTNTTYFVSQTDSYNRALEAATVALVTKTVGSTTFYNTDSCARVLIARTNTAKTDFTLGMKLLFISQSLNVSASDIGEVNLTKTLMQATGIPYDWIYLTDASYVPLYQSSLPLFDSNGNPKYYGIVMSMSNPKSVSNTVELLSAGQKAQIRQYQFQYGVRMVALNGYPTDYSGMQAGGSNILNGTAMSIVPAFATAHADLFSGVQPTAVFNTSNQYYSWIGATVGTWTVENFLTMKESVSDSVTKVVAAIITEPTTKTQTLQYFVGNADFLDHGPVLANVWLTWVTRGIWLGNRRIYMSAQIDDYFLATGQYGQPDDLDHSIRITGTDVQLTTEYLVNLNKKAPGKQMTLAMAVNCAEAAQGLAPTLITAAQTYKDFYFWESHTWTHKDFTKNPEEACDAPTNSTLYSQCHNTTQDEATEELVLNNNWVRDVLFPAQGLDTPTWSKNSMITPAITGLFNAAALAALNATGMTCVVGDNSRPAELLPENPYLGMFTTKEFNGFDGIFIIPRYATEIYYNSGTPENNMLQYNERYGPNRLPQFPKQFFDFNSTLDDLLAREAETNFRHLAFFRHDPYMFHQCNLNHFSYTYAKDTTAKQWSLVSLWLESMVDRYNQMLTFPMINVKQQDLRDVFFARREREFCGLSGSIAVTAGSTTAVTLTSTAGCEASLTGPTSCGSLSGCRTETYAGDSTVWATMVAGAGKQVPVTKAWSN